MNSLVKHFSKLDLDDYLPYLVNRVGTIIADQFGQEALAPHRLSIAMWRVMAALAARGSQRQIDIVDLTSIEASTLSRLVSRLAHMGLVMRARSANSNREVAVELSARGAALVARLIPIALEYEQAGNCRPVAGGNTGVEGLMPPARLRQYEKQKWRPGRAKRNPGKAGQALMPMSGHRAAAERVTSDGGGNLSNAVSRSTLTGTLSSRSPGCFQVLAVMLCGAEIVNCPDTVGEPLIMSLRLAN